MAWGTWLQCLFLAHRDEYDSAWLFQNLEPLRIFVDAQIDMNDPNRSS